MQVVEPVADPVEIRYRGRPRSLTARGLRAGSVVAFRWGFSEQGHDHEQTSFLLLDEHVLMAQPVLFDDDRRG